MIHNKSLVGSILVATPQKPETKSGYNKEIVLICAHDETGAIGFTINKPIPALYLSDLLSQLSLDSASSEAKTPVYLGGSTDTGRGFVLHSKEYLLDYSIAITESIYLTASLSMLEHITNNKGPKQKIVMLGYHKWETGELEAEIKNNQWLWTVGTSYLTFLPSIDKWQAILNQINIHNGIMTYDGGSC
jgi:putative transcriptional regulator